MTDDIQRWSHTSPGMIEQSCGSWVEYRTLLRLGEDHLADKTAALEAQAEGHRKILINNDTDWANREAIRKTALIAKHVAELAEMDDKLADAIERNEKNTKTFQRLVSERDSSDKRVEALEAELAAQAEEHKANIDDHLEEVESARAAQAEEHEAANEVKDAGRDRELDRVVDHWTNLLLQEQTKHAAEIAALRGEGAERLEYIARDLARLLLVSAREDITEFHMNRSTYDWLVERANA